jgi:hypothetical protein
MKSAEVHGVGAELAFNRISGANVAAKAETRTKTGLGTKPESPLDSKANRLRMAVGVSRSGRPEGARSPRREEDLAQGQITKRNRQVIEKTATSIFIYLESRQVAENR